MKQSMIHGFLIFHGQEIQLKKKYRNLFHAKYLIPLSLFPCYQALVLCWGQYANANLLMAVLSTASFLITYRHLFKISIPIFPAFEIPSDLQAKRGPI